MSQSPQNKPENKLDEFLKLLRNEHDRLGQFRRRTVLFSLFAILLSGLSVFFIFENYLYTQSAVKIVFLITLALVALYAAWKVKENFSFSTFQQFYTDFLSDTGKSNLLSAVDLHLFPDQKNSLFYSAAVSENLTKSDPIKTKSDLDKYIRQKADYSTYKRSMLLFTGSVLLFGSLSLAFTESASRTFQFWETFSKPNPYQYTITPGDVTLEHGSVFAPEINFPTGNLPEQILLSFKTDVEENYRSRQVQNLGENAYKPAEIELTNTISYRFEMDGFVSEEYEAEIRLRPRFEELTAEVDPPNYTQLSNTEFNYPFSEISFYPGSEIIFRGVTNKELTSISVNAIENFEKPEMESGSGQTEIIFSVRPEKNDTLSFVMSDVDNLQNSNQYRTILKRADDRPPVVSILEPTGSFQSSNPDVLNIRYRATDDFGLVRAQLMWDQRRAFVETPIQGSETLSSPGNGYTENFQWDLSSLNLRPRDELEFRIRVWDNDEVSGPKYSDSNIVTLIVPSLADSFEELDRRERDVQGEMDEISENFRNMEEEYDDFLERLRQNPEGGFEEEQMLEEIREQQSDIDQAVEEMNERFEELQSEIMQNENVSEETQRAYRELQQLMKELDDPALREAMEELQRALQNMSPDEIEEALENVNFNENLYKERLERTVELFKQLKMNSDLDKLARQYEDLSERIKPQEAQSLENLQNELDNSEDDIESISEQLENLDQNPPKRSEQQIRQLKEESQSQLNDVSEELEQLNRKTEDEKNRGEEQTGDEIQNEQQEISNQLQEQAEKIRSARSEMSGQQIQVNILALQQSLYTLLELSDLQEYITKTTADTRGRSQGFVDLARNQKSVADQFSITADTLFKVSSELPGVPNQINRKKAEVERSLSQSLEEMVERNQRNASISSREAFAGINDLASMLASLIDQLMDQQNGGGGGGGMSMQQMVEQLQQMSGDQQQLNQQLQQMINDMQGDRLSQEQSERLDQLARQQNEIRKQLRELQQRGAFESGDRVLSELQRMMDEMEDSINDMRGGLTDPIMTERQQNILSRMLDAEQALQQRGEKDEREGTASSEYDQTLPPDMTLEELEQEIRTRLQDPNYTRFSETYQRLIEKYFEQLRRFEEQPVRE
jgi:Ca2+/Na+ antiporter